VPGQDGSVTGLSGATANGTSDNVETSSKRSLTGRRRDASTGSKRSNRQVTGDGEKARPDSAGRAQAGSEPRPKKRGGFLSFLSCCGGSDENQELGSRESTQPPKTPATASQPAKLKSQQQQIPPNASATNTSADGSKEVIDEKAGHQSNHKEPSAAVPILPSPLTESEKPPPVVVQPDNPVPSIPPGVATIQPNAETKPLQAERNDLQPEAPTTGPSHIDTTQRNLAQDSSSNPTANPVVSVIAPTPTVPQTEDVAGENIIQDRTPEQAARDTDIEMTDAGPSLPLATSDVRQSPELESQTRERSSSASSSRIDLPPPPPLAERQMQNQHSDAGVIAGAGAGAGILAAGAGVAAHQASNEPSAVSTPEQAQKWLLPPITPQFSGKKCLVLDLDETLVHSSFKVSRVADSFYDTPLLTFTPPDPSPSRFHNSCRNRRPISQRLRNQAPWRRCLPQTRRRDLRSCRLHRIRIQVRRSSSRPTRHLQLGPPPSIPRVVLQPPGQLRQGFEPSWPPSG
jgi:RNA polymerase II subunit A small phosphatase-like protein